MSKGKKRLRSLLQKKTILLFLILVGSVILGVFLFKNKFPISKQSGLLADNPGSDYYPCRNVVTILERPKEFLKYLVCPDAVYEFSPDPHLGGLPKRSWHFSQLDSGLITAAQLVNSTMYLGGKGLSVLNLDTNSIDWYSDHNSPMQYTGAVTELSFDQDTNILWIGTSGQLFQYDIDHKSFTAVEPKADAQRILVNQILITPSSVYILDQGEIHRLDKQSQNWQSFDDTILGTSPGEQHPGLYGQLLYSNEKVYLLEPLVGDEHPYGLWYASDSETMHWQKYPAITKRVEKDYPTIHGYTPAVELFGSDLDTNAVILKASQYNDVTYYYFDVTKNEVGVARTDFITYSAAEPKNDGQHEGWLNTLYNDFENRRTYRK